VKALSGKEFVRMLESNGWTLQRINGSHHICAKAGSPSASQFRFTAMTRSRSGFSAI